MKILYAGLCLGVFLLTGCTTTLKEGGWSIPQPVKSEYFQTVNAGFIIDPKNPYQNIRYILQLKIIKPFVNGAFLEVSFEDPEDANKPIIMTRRVGSTDTEVKLESPQIHGLKDEKDYTVIVRAYEDETRHVFFGEHKEMIKPTVFEKKILKMKR